ncbi:AraC family transcriptional regulator [Vagococcus sp. BWB3-3]|uniref:AraC family transcriptional regulator n=1 Tax=Vagococcus allomyrinae TaxID=2794353 RepID=A0A940SUK6_9ENTE|nr:AraC family transcriptional regulator [Vagococcus allomyrinae]
MNHIKKKDGFKDERHIIIPPGLLQEAKEHPLVEGTLLNELGYYPSARYHYRERYNENVENILIYCLEGEGTIEINNSQRFILTRGTLFIIPENTAHRYYSDGDDPWSILWAHFETPLSDYFELNRLIPIAISSPEKNALIQSHFINLFDIAEKTLSLGNIICTSQLIKLILTEIVYLKDGLSNDKQNSYLTKSIRYLNEHLSESISLVELATYLNISQSYLSSIYNKYLNTSPIDYLIQIRIEQACRYLKMTDLKIYEIAKKVGYQDPYYFSRIFKKITGFTPKNYRQQTNHGTQQMTARK